MCVCLLVFTSASVCVCASENVGLCWSVVCVWCARSVLVLAQCASACACARNSVCASVCVCAIVSV